MLVVVEIKVQELEVVMQYMMLKLKKLGEIKLCVIILVLGILMGIILARIFRGFYWNQIDILDTNYISEIKNVTIDHAVLFRYVLWKDFRSFILFWIFSATALGIPYMTLSVFYGGFQAGFFLAVIMMRYNLKGIILMIGYTFPHYLIYIPVALICLRSGYWLCRSMYYDTKMNRRGKAERIAKHMVLIIILGTVLMFGGLLETYVGSFILKKILVLF
jgi:stage II sporulation protein M